MMLIVPLLLAAACQRVDRETPVPLAAKADSAPATAAAAWTRVANGDPSIDSLFVITRDRGIREGLDSLDALAARDPAADGRGHELAHALGRFAAASRGDISILGECTPVFQSGCYHGALEGLFMRGATVDRASVGRICAPGGADKPGYERLECWHGLGHGLMVRFDGDHRQALPLCDALQTPRGRRECQDGIYMERAIRAIGASSTDAEGPAAQAHAGHGGGGHGEHGAGAEHGGHAASGPKTHSGKLSHTELGRLCAAEDARHQPSCWAYQPIALLLVHNDQPRAVLRGCDAAPTAAVRDCYQGFGKQYLGAMRGQVPPMIAACQAGNHAYTADCLMGGVEYFTDIEWNIEPGITFCAQVPVAAKDRCYTMIGERLALAHPARREAEAACHRVEAPYVQACLAGTRTRDM
ncbi:hypothetical protein [Longimicrobium sp.]|uniref:hypothetical protein n=1 Tax=Longimicrobium sp. TaxID=2029185 RepID=UPI003B3A9805